MCVPIQDSSGLCKSVNTAKTRSRDVFADENGFSLHVRSVMSFLLCFYVITDFLVYPIWEMVQANTVLFSTCQYRVAHKNRLEI